MLKLHIAATSALVFSTSVSAQTDFVRICVNSYFEPGNGVRYEIFAHLFNPRGDIRAVISNLGFRIKGFDFTDFTYNPAFDSDFFGPASVNITSSEITFQGGNTLPPLNDPGGPDSSNPLLIAEVRGSITDFWLEGQVDGAYIGSPFDELYTLQTSIGTQGDMPYEIRFCNFPAPGTAGVLVFGGVIASRRQR